MQLEDTGVRDEGRETPNLISPGTTAGQRLKKSKEAAIKHPEIEVLWKVDGHLGTK